MTKVTGMLSGASLEEVYDKYLQACSRAASELRYKKPDPSNQLAVYEAMTLDRARDQWILKYRFSSYEI